MGDPEPVGVEGDDEGLEEDFEEVLARDPHGDPLFDRLELLIFGLGLCGSVLTLLVSTWTSAFGFAAGWLVCQLNVGVMRRAMRQVIAVGVGTGMSVVVLMLKTTVLLVGCWLLLTRTEANPVAFAIGFGATVAGLVVGSVICAPRSSPKGGGRTSDEG